MMPGQDPVTRWPSRSGTRGTVAVVRSDTPAGEAIADEFDGRGSRVLLIDHDPDTDLVADVAREDGRLRYRLDMGAVDKWRRVADDLARRFESIDVLVVVVGSDARGVAPTRDSPYDWLNTAAYREVLHDAGSAAVSSIFELLPAIAGAEGSIILLAPHAARKGVTDNPLATALGYGLCGMVAGLAAPLERLGVRIHALVSADGKSPPPPVLMSLIDRILAGGETGRCWVADELRLEATDGVPVSDPD